MKKLNYILFAIIALLLGYILFFDCGRYKLSGTDLGFSLYSNSKIAPDLELRIASAANLVKGIYDLKLARSEEYNFAVDTINKDTAKYYQSIFLNRRDTADKLNWPQPDTFLMKNDISEGVLYSLKKIFLAMDAEFGPDMYNVTRMDNFGFVAYHANYGKRGHKVEGQYIDKYNSTTFIQLARKNLSTQKWVVVDNQLYNFGDLKPPKLNNGN